MDAHAQSEIRAYAEVIGRQIVAKWVPLTWEAFEDYRLSAVSFSRIELEILKILFSSNRSDAIAIAIENEWLDEQGNTKRASRERSEFESKLRSLGVTPPWLS
jgi:thymidylate synthase (FAD)